MKTILQEFRLKIFFFNNMKIAKNNSNELFSFENSESKEKKVSEFFKNKRVVKLFKLFSSHRSARKRQRIS